MAERASVVLVEDDHLQAEYISDLIRSWDLAVDVVANESDFRRGLASGSWDPPNHPAAFVVDVMLRWSNPRPDMPAPPPDVVEEGHYRAGVRCAHLIENYYKGARTPRIVLLTVLAPDDLGDFPSFARFIRKGGDNHELRRWLQDAMPSPAATPRPTS